DARDAHLVPLPRARAGLGRHLVQCPDGRLHRADGHRAADVLARLAAGVLGAGTDRPGVVGAVFLVVPRSSGREARLQRSRTSVDPRRRRRPGERPRRRSFVSAAGDVGRQHDDMGHLSVAACVSFGWYFIPTWQPQYYMDVHDISYEDTIVQVLPFT